MLTIVFKNEEGDTIPRDWHVGEPRPEPQTEWVPVLVQADGDELEHLRQTFSGIPHSSSVRVSVWGGDFAAFIANNL